MIKQMCSFPEPMQEWLESKNIVTGVGVPEIVRNILRERMEDEKRKEAEEKAKEQPS